MNDPYHDNWNRSSSRKDQYHPLQDDDDDDDDDDDEFDDDEENRSLPRGSIKPDPPASGEFGLPPPPARESRRDAPEGDGDSEEDSDETQPYQEENLIQERRGSGSGSPAILFMMMALCCLCLCLLTVIVIVILVATGAGKSPAPTEAQPLIPIYPNFLPDYSIAAMEANLLSPQRLAYDWFLQDPNWNDYLLDRKLQRFAMATFYFSTRGANWTTHDDWISYTVHECEWWQPKEQDSPSCWDSTNATTGLLRKLHLPSNQLVGTLPLELQLLSHLESIQLDGNTLFGTVTTLAPQIRFLNLSGNFLSEFTPTNWQHLQQLQELDLSHNQLVTTTTPDGQMMIPMLIQLSNLLHLNLAHNQWTGPWRISQDQNQTQLTSLQLQNNQITGTIPPDVGNLTELRYLGLDGNPHLGISPSGPRVPGRLPSQLGLLAKLEELSAYDLPGIGSSLPTQFGNLKAIRILGLNGNSIQQSLPSQLGLLTTLEQLWLYDNRLTGSIPSELGALVDHKLNAFIVYENELEGVVPNLLCVLEQAFQFDCKSTVLCGCDCVCDPSLVGFLGDRIPGVNDLPPSGAAVRTSPAVTNNQPPSPAREPAVDPSTANPTVALQTTTRSQH